MHAFFMSFYFYIYKLCCMDTSRWRHISMSDTVTCNYIEFMSFSQNFVGKIGIWALWFQVIRKVRSLSKSIVYTQSSSAKWWEGRVSDRKRKGKHNQAWKYREYEDKNCHNLWGSFLLVNSETKTAKCIWGQAQGLSRALNKSSTKLHDIWLP